ncbi:MAG: hypothetical protein FWD04_03940, partial [Conexibacteraceae bacterium]|nr:hypothetical protein [Conexibacteraceae bacterium]
MLVLGTLVMHAGRHHGGLGVFGQPARPVQAVDPAVFSKGSCIAYAPTTGDRHLTVFLDAGHGGLDPGSVGTTESGRTIYE